MSIAADPLPVAAAPTRPAWYRAFRQSGEVLPLWRIHRHIGMGGDQLVAALAGEEFEAEHGEDVRAAENVLYMALIDEVRPFADARALLEEGRARLNGRSLGGLDLGAFASGLARSLDRLVPFDWRVAPVFPASIRRS